MSGLPWGGGGGGGQCQREDPVVLAAAWRPQPLGPTNVHGGGGRKLFMWLGPARGLT